MNCSSVAKELNVYAIVAGLTLTRDFLFTFLNPLVKGSGCAPVTQLLKCLTPFADSLVLYFQFYHDGNFPHRVSVYDFDAHSSQ